MSLNFNINNFKIYSFADCGVNISCGFYFSYINNSFSKPPVLLYTWLLDVSLGYNRVLFNTSYDVPKGSMVYLDQTIDTGRVAVESIGNATFSDMKWGQNFTGYYESNTIGSLANISAIKYFNSRFYLNSLCEFYHYQNFFKLVHDYEAALLYNLSIRLNNLTTIFARPVLIDRKQILIK